MARDIKRSREESAHTVAKCTARKGHQSNTTAKRSRKGAMCFVAGDNRKYLFCCRGQPKPV